MKRSVAKITKQRVEMIRERDLVLRSAWLGLQFLACMLIILRLFMMAAETFDVIYAILGVVVLGVWRFPRPPAAIVDEYEVEE